MSVQPVGAVGAGTSGVAGVSAVAGLSPSLPPVAPDAAAGAEFAGALQQAGLGGAVGRLEDLQRLQSTADDLAVKAVTGQLADPSQYTIAATEAQLATQMTVAVRNKAVEAYSEIMRMQL
ncbi:flagellar hook-basal body complex protein FliE [Aquipuribacter hungaricus]|uniref:Flagellar hook-basal body complex protein FliE n=1 Tax=Aquipuribacter hungaricus TaxID=545624 RepID=A0ABV7WI36_9MICO